MKQDKHLSRESICCSIGGLGYALARDVRSGEKLELSFPLKKYQTGETAQKAHYQLRWKDSAVTSIDPKGKKVPLYADRSDFEGSPVCLCAPRYP